MGKNREGKPLLSEVEFDVMMALIIPSGYNVKNIENKNNSDSFIAKMKENAYKFNYIKE